METPPGAPGVHRLGNQGSHAAAVDLAEAGHVDADRPGPGRPPDRLPRSGRVAGIDYSPEDDQRPPIGIRHDLKLALHQPDSRLENCSGSSRIE